MEKRKIASEEPGSFTGGKQIIWSLRTFSSMACAMVIGYITFYGTNMLEIPPATVGMLIMLSKIIDAVSDLAGGVLVDRTNTRWGKARPYEISIIGIWVGTILMYACPDLGMTGKCIWLFIWYTLLNDVFFTLLNAAEPVYMMRAIPNRQDMEKTASLNGIFTIIGAMAVSVVYPILMASMGSTKAGWTKMALITALPMMAIGLLRMLLIPEVKDVQTEKKQKEKISVQDIIKALTSNRYIYLHMLIILVVNMLSNFSSATTYYFTYIVGDQAMMSVASLPGMITPFLLLIFPMFLKKHTIVKVSKICVVIGIVGCVIKQFAGANMPMIILGGFIFGIGTLPMTAFFVVLLADIVDYNEYKTGQRVEGIYASLASFGQKIGIALASAISGFLLQASGFISSNTATQPDSALSMIRAMFGIVPAIMMALILFALFFYNLEPKMPEVREKLAQIRGKVSQA